MKEYKYTINGHKYVVAVGEIAEGVADVTVNGEQYKVEMEQEPVAARPKVTPVAPKPAAATAQKSAEELLKQNSVKAPLPGVINEVRVNVGDEVQDGQTVVILEAMKMANNIDAEKSGRVTQVCVEPGQTVMEGTPLVVIE